MIDNNFLSKIYGHNEIKEELYTIRSWFLNEQYLNDDNVLLPKGILVYGDPGNGKTLLIREYAKSFNAPVFNVTCYNEKDNTIYKIFEKAREEKFAIVIIDEIDSLIESNFDYERIIKEELDGINQKGKILVLATANNRRKLSPSLVRQGRFDRKFCLDNISDKFLIQMFKNNFDQLNIDYSNLDFDLVFDLVGKCSGAEVKLICNDLNLRYPKQKINSQMFETSYEIIIKDCFYDNDFLQYKNYMVSIHEAGHILMLKKYKADYKFYKAYFTEYGGETRRSYRNHLNDDLKIRLEEIEILLGGRMAEKVIFNHYEPGSLNDIATAIEAVNRLVQRSCVFGMKYFEENIFTHRDERKDSEKHHYEIEKKVSKIVKKHTRKTYHYLKKNKKTLLLVANELYKKGIIYNEDINKYFITN